ncbi:Vta1 like-domain-containing protein [Xylariales sp. AK1849]|nr:Vta1 like-domain-containing protein [Xylariales sp. AK1849]
MAANIPAKLKQAGITPFIVRATQLQQAKPVISYWCEYWVVNQILAKQLHQADEECLQYTMALMDKLEQTKQEQTGNDAILDDAAGQAYVEQFAQETFERAMRPLKASKVSQQTAITFEAAATFFSLINIWGTPDAETEQKIKFSKWNAARILRAIKEGKDPNESNPKPDEDKLEENDPELEAIMNGDQPRPATVEDVPDDQGKGYLDPAAAAAASGHRHSPAPVSAPTSPPQGSAPAPEQVSPIAPPDQPTPDGYFPSAPSAADRDPPLELPSAPGTIGDPDMSVPSPPFVQPSHGAQSPGAPSFSKPSLPDTPRDFYRPAPTPQDSVPAPLAPLPPPTQQPSYTSTPQQPPAPQSNRYYQQPSQQPSQPQSYGGGPPTNAVYNADDMAIVQAQKHAKWAISALNFEDVPTAVRELKSALAILGAN